ncbi:unnamed protein product [Adineta steineri]|uniref:Hedgehog protein Hint domain-containing protein n=1 Tax=Adineta steineri TaxID=433720 RepID=A0A813Z959_9BILA|nr:unnamed protein product [Adineta steineri]CAF4022825.1 unnamed protein product [Adineta steineri]
MINSRQNAIMPVVYDLPYVPPSSYRKNRSASISGSYCLCGNKLKCLLGIILTTIVGIALVIALAFIITSIKNDESTNNNSTIDANNTSDSNITTITTGVAPPNSGCYFGGDFVNLVNGNYRRIDQLQVGDRIWSLANDGQTLIEDEMILMMHAESNNSILFYTFITFDEHFLSLTGSHYIAVIDIELNKTIYMQASKVTKEYQLIMPNRTVKINKIIQSFRTGFYSPLTTSGNLLVNNISTSVYVASYGALPEILHRVFTPIRIYYYLMRWLFGNNYDPFESNITYGLHPLPAFLKANKTTIRFLYNIEQNMILIIIMTLAMYLSQKYIKRNAIRLFLYYVQYFI